MTHQEFVTKLAITHPNLEVLSEYIGSKEPILVRCKIHNYSYSTKPNYLLSGRNCPECAKEKRSMLKRKTVEEFIIEARAIHGSKYDYSKVVYVNNNTKVCVICPIHGEFWISPSKHLQRGQGCPKCGLELIGYKKRLSINEVETRFREIHGNKYIYDFSEYRGTYSKISITCLEHGEFKQTVKAHLNGQGCPKCHQSKLERKVCGILNKNNIKFIEQYKFDKLGRQSLDFYLPECNIAIECQGKQHFESLLFFGGDEEFAKIVARDNIKHNICKERNIKLYYCFDDKVIQMEEIFNTNSTIYNKDNLFEVNTLITKILN